MSKNLIIVESPAKAKTMSKYLGKDFTALASYGHVRDLLPKKGAVDTANGFAMKYVLIEKNQKHVDAIIKAMKKADALYLATRKVARQKASAVCQANAGDQLAGLASCVVTQHAFEVQRILDVFERRQSRK